MQKTVRRKDFVTDVNRHNIAVCEREFPSSAIHVTSSDKSVLLQTATGFIADKKERKLEEINILLDNLCPRNIRSRKNRSKD